MTTVPARDFYEWPMNHETAECEGCGKEMDVPSLDDIDRDMKEPYWWKENVETYIGGNYDKFHAYCSSCYAEKMGETLQPEEVNEE